MPLNIKRAFRLKFLAAGVPSLSHLIKFAWSSSALALFQESTFASSAGSLDLIVVEVK